MPKSDTIIKPFELGNLPGVGINNASTIQDLFGPMRHGQWISRKGLPCASDDLTAHEAHQMIQVRPHHVRQRKAHRY